MGRRHILAVLSVTLLCLPLFTGCGDDNPVSPQDRLIGTWDCTRYEITEGGVTEDVLDTTLDALTLTFSSSGSYTVVETAKGGVPVTDSGPYSATSSTITIDSGTSEEVTFDYSISGSVLTMTGTVEGADFDLRFVKA